MLAAASGGNPHQRPERFAAVPYVIQVDPNLQVRDRYGSVDSVPLLAQPDVPASVVTQLPGALTDRSFYAQVPGVPATEPALGHGWSSAAFAPYVLTSGHAPNSDDEIVVAGRPSAVASLWSPQADRGPTRGFIKRMPLGDRFGHIDREKLGFAAIGAVAAMASEVILLSSGPTAMKASRVGSRAISLICFVSN